MHEWVIMPFSLINTSATYERAMNLIFHDMINHNMGVYIDNTMVKLQSKSTYLDELYSVFKRMHMYNIKMNQIKIPST
jgi:hypothetical protein